jgi:SOS response regulatory protein OraA/RecX
VTSAGLSVTALRPRAGNRTAVELDHHAWRVFDDVCIAAAGLAVGQVLTRERAAALARARRRQQALRAAVRALERHDLATADLDATLRRRGVRDMEREHVIAALQRSGVVDERRFALGRSSSLAERGVGDEAIAADLLGRDVDRELVDEVLDTLAPERERAERIVARRGLTPATLRLLARRGFGESSLESLADALADSGHAD